MVAAAGTPEAVGAVGETSAITDKPKPTISQLLESGYVVIRASSRRAAIRSGLDSPRHRETGAIVAVWSWDRAAKGGLYLVAPELAGDILRVRAVAGGEGRRIPGIGKLRGPYDDLARCWGD